MDKKNIFFFLLISLLVAHWVLTCSANPDIVTVPGSAGPIMTQFEIVEQTLKSEGIATAFPLITLEPAT